MQSTVLVLVGSFYPLHDGHLDILLTAKRAAERVGPPVTECRLIPTHPAALRRKFPGLPPPRQFRDDRAEFAAPVLARRAGEFARTALVWDASLVAPPRPGRHTAASVVLEMRAACAAAGSAVVQVFGADSVSLADRVFATAPIALPDLPPVVVVSDGRTAPADEAEGASVPVIFEPNPRHPPVSSTLLRQRSPERYHRATVARGCFTDCVDSA